jgi:hypothetical protein
MFHRIYESMGLGMHPTSLYPRRSRVAPSWRNRSAEALALSVIRDCTPRWVCRQTILLIGFASILALTWLFANPHNPNTLTLDGHLQA